MSALERVIEEASLQQNKLYDAQALVMAALAMADEPGDPQGRVMQQAIDLLDEIAGALDSVELARLIEVAT